MKSGIYIIRCKVTRMVYVGQSQDIIKRWSVHRATLKYKKHHCRYLQNVYNQYGPSKFEYVVVEYCTLDKLDDREQYWINIYGTKNIYNISHYGGQARGYKYSEEAKKRMSVRAIKIAADPEERKRRSERCRKQHAEGRIGKRKYSLKTRCCLSCEKSYLPRRLENGQPSGSKYCHACRPKQHYGGNYKHIVNPYNKK